MTVGSGHDHHDHTLYSHHSNDTKSINGIMEDDDGRTRNAKAQRRHREKRKAHLKTLEESVQLLTNQLEDARRQLSSAAYNNRMGGGVGGNGGPPVSPGSKEFIALQQENTYLRDENAELRRQVYSYSMTRHGYQGGSGGAQGGPGGGGNGGAVDGEIKQEGYNSYPGGQAPGPGQGQQVTSPREGSGGRDGQLPPNNDHFTPLSRGSRSRVMSSSSAPTASPYLPPTSAFPTDPRAHALSQPQPQMERYPPIRYDSHMYNSSSSANHSPNTSNQPPPHNLPRSGLGYEHMDMYSGGNRGDDGGNWGPDAGPPPFQGSVYPVPYGDGPPQDDWRNVQDHSH